MKEATAKQKLEIMFNDTYVFDSELIAGEFIKTDKVEDDFDKIIPIMVDAHKYIIYYCLTETGKEHYMLGYTIRE